MGRVAGVQRSTISIVLRSFQTAGLIAQHRGGIGIVDRAGLEEMACECHGKICQSFARLLPVPLS
ncbi:winged helix-turn-helix domain-containing protein [Microvirga sp. BT689]|uniref:helix-turn-helix domain-containing protein n=1 Tax=Microvirga arvi TaxID=2778731 RepID=UPI001950BE21|nr:helix-turn-helix domain-containing protein [Microvirga arvi]MBM6583931.1 winged helix-turn-helix domain-containing protein [Microvirga arvi]